MLKSFFFSFGILFSILVKGNNHTEFYHIDFPKGSHVVSEKVKISANKVYRILPEKVFTRVYSKGQDEEGFSTNLKYILAKNRALSLLKYFKSSGLEDANLKISYSTLPHLLLLKEKSKKVEDLIVNTEKIKKDCECFDIDVSTSVAIRTKNGNFYMLEAESFQTENGISIASGIVNFCIHELSVNEKLFLGWHDLRNTQLHQPVLEFYSKATYNNKEVVLKPYQSLQIHFNNIHKLESGNLRYDNLSSEDDSWVQKSNSSIIYYSENFDFEILNKFSLHSKTNLDNEINLSKLVVNVNHLGWNRLSYNLFYNEQKSKQVVLNDNAPYLMRYVEDSTQLILPVYANQHFNNLYHFTPFNLKSSGKIIGLSTNESTCWKIFSTYLKEDADKNTIKADLIFEEQSCFLTY